jgi:hypothetical protein
MNLKITFYRNEKNEILATVKSDEINIALSAPEYTESDPFNLQNELLSLPVFIRKIHERGLEGKPLEIEEEEIVIT